MIWVYLSGNNYIKYISVKLFIVRKIVKYRSLKIIYHPSVTD